MLGLVVMENTIVRTYLEVDKWIKNVLQKSLLHEEHAKSYLNNKV